MDITAIDNIKGKKYELAFGNKNNRKRKNPYDPSFSNIPANNTLPVVGASTCALGSQR